MTRALCVVLAILSLSASAAIVTNTTRCFNCATAEGGNPALIDGGTFTIEGTFPAKSTAAPILFDRFESGTLGSTIQTPTVGAINWLIDSGDVTYSNTRAFGGSRSAMMDWTDSVTFDNLAYINVSNLSRIYFSYRAYKVVLGGTDPEGWNWKQGAITSGDIDIYHGTVQFNHSVELGAGSTKDSNIVSQEGLVGVTAYGDSATTLAPNDQWLRYELYVLLSTPNVADGRRYSKINGDGQFTHSSFPSGHWASPSGAIAHTTYYGDAVVTRGNSELIQRAILPFYLRGGYSAQAWVDEVYIDSTQVRLEIGNAPTFSSSDTTRSPQSATAWSTGSITFTPNQGSMACGSDAYGYVISETGSVTSLGKLGEWAC